MVRRKAFGKTRISAIGGGGGFIHLRSVHTIGIKKNLVEQNASICINNLQIIVRIYVDVYTVL